MPSTDRSTVHLGVRIARPAAAVYAFASDPANLPRWASGLGSAVEQVGGQWFADSPMGRVGFTFVPPNDHGVLDHDVALPDGTIVRNPMRVIADGPSCDVVFTLRRRPDMDDAAFAGDAAAVTRDLEALKHVVEQA
jgi:Polyketide cyclase / dehydrase and lipid transport